MKRSILICTFVAGALAGASASVLLPSVYAGSGGGLAGPPPCPADLAPSPNGDGMVNVDDLLVLLAAWGDCKPEPPPPACNPSGTWVNAVAPSYSCGFGLISFNISQWTFTQTATSLTVTSPGLGLSMTGAPADCEAGNSFSVTKTLPGSCTETYTLAGTFSSPTQFSGTFTAMYSGGSCFDCTTQVFNVSAARQ